MKGPAARGAEARRESPKFVYGPVPSRRLGLSLGVDILPFKTCTLDCIYCQLGPTERMRLRRRSYFPIRGILGQVREALARAGRVDVITFSGSGEPTLNKDLGRIIRAIKKMTRIPVAVLTNGTLLSRKDVREDLMAADIVVPSLDAVSMSRFRRVNRPHPSLEAGRIISGLETFRKDYRGQIWLEIMLVRGVNDSRPDIRAFQSAISRIRPDRVQLNTVVRPPADPKARPLGLDDLGKIRAELGDIAEIAANFVDTAKVPTDADLREAVTSIVGRRPVTAGDIAVSLGRRPAEVLKALADLCRAGAIRPVTHAGATFYEAARAAAGNRPRRA